MPAKKQSKAKSKTSKAKATTKATKTSTKATTKATKATTKATKATTKATKVSTKATKAATKATKASTKATKASTKATKVTKTTNVTKTAASKSPKTTKSPKKVSKTTTIVAPPAPTPATTETSAPQEPSIDDAFKSLLSRFTELRTLIAGLARETKALNKRANRELREASRRSRKNKNTSGVKRAPSGFAKPGLISDELCDFLGQPHGSEMARTEVTKLLTVYIKDNSLQDQKNKRIIHPDDKLGALLNVGPDDNVTYFNLQKYMKPHFPKKVTA